VAQDGGSGNGREKRLERLQIMLTDTELDALDDWRFKARMPSRSAAVRELLRRGLAAEGYSTQTGQRSASGEFGVISDDRDP
jgi:metal-responsive CopG/Arc/MetJ family transcriptional regulator